MFPVTGGAATGSLFVGYGTSSIVMTLAKFFCSLRLAIFLLMGLAALSIVGTLIPQNASPEVYGERYGETAARFLRFLSIDDMYHAWWFYLLLALLTVNIIACSLRRFSRDWRMLVAPRIVLDEDLEKTLPCSRSWAAPWGGRDAEESVSHLLRKKFSAPRITRSGEEIHFFARKQPFARLGVHALHGGIVVIVAGVVIGSLSGFTKAYVEIEEKGAITTVLSRSGQPIDLGFTVRCDGFSVSYYDTGAPKEYRSILSIVDKGKTVIERKPVLVNHPLTFRGITFYQSGYSAAAFLFSVRDRKSGESRLVTVRDGETASLPNGDQVVVMDSVDEIRWHSPRYSGPAVHVAVLPANGSPESFVLMKNHPDVNAGKGGVYQLSYGGVSAWKTVLQVAKDPGVPVVWGGCILLMVGFGMVFFVSHREIWIRLGKGRVVMAGCSDKNLPAFRIFFDELAEALGNVSSRAGTARKP